MATQKIRIPYDYEPRSYQVPLLAAIDNGIKRAVAVWHRRAGKDKTLINLIVKKAFERVGAYYYYFPTQAQGRKILWHGIDKAGMPFLDHIPPEIIAQKKDQEMMIRLTNGSIIQLIGTDRAEVVGPNPVGCVFSEYSLQDPRAWDFVRPILAENEGWAVFNYTPRGMNHGYKLFQMAMDNEDWFCELLTVDDTDAITKKAIHDEKRSGMSDELIQQEFYCSWEYGLEGAYYLKQIARARKEDRITDLPIMDVPVHTAWDLGVRDDTAIWFWQNDGQYKNIIDYYENSGEGLAHYAQVLKEKGYLYGEHYAPHDADQRGKFSGQTFADRARDELNLDFNVLPREDNIDAGIEMARAVFPIVRFDKDRCEQGLNALMNYQKEWNEKRQVFNARPQHNWASNGADAFRYMARAVREHQADTDLKDDADPWRRPRPAQAGQGWMA